MHDEDDDRAAILRRRRRFIALALSVSSGAVACEEPARPAPRAEEHVEVPSAEPSDEPAGSGGARGVGAVASPEGREPAPPDPAEVRHAEEAKRRWERRARSRSHSGRICLTIGLEEL